jgi:glutamate formiminotransferase/formiminotetrahydrofolate cyclodeaminase
MKQYANVTLKEYLDELASKNPTPGGGSAAALTAALGATLLSMVANYSKGRSGKPAVEKRIQKTLNESERFRKRLLRLVDLDAQAYLKVVQTRRGPEKAKKAARKKAREVPFEICRVCYSALDLAPVLVRDGNPYLLSDIQCAVELLLAGFNAAMVNVEINQ